MKERPILFSVPMVRALLEGVKRQTRRVVKFPHAGSWERGQITDSWVDQADPVGTYPTILRCPYGEPRDRLWVKETTWKNGGYVATDWMPEELTRKRPAIHMPRSLSRLTLEVTGIRVERVEDITEEEAVAEGFRDNGLISARGNFLLTFYDLNKRAPRGSNPWVWVINFKRVPREIAR